VAALIWWRAWVCVHAYHPISGHRDSMTECTVYCRYCIYISTTTSEVEIVVVYSVYTLRESGRVVILRSSEASVSRPIDSLARRQNVTFSNLWVGVDISYNGQPPLPHVAPRRTPARSTFKAMVQARFIRSRISSSAVERSEKSQESSAVLTTYVYRIYSNTFTKIASG
jgi:hypothetical protein